VYYLFEIKLNQTPSEKALTGIRAFQRMYGEENIANSVILCRTDNDFMVKGALVTNIMYSDFDKLIS